MKKANKILSVFLSLLMVLSIIPMASITASATTYSGKCGDNVFWSFDEYTSTLIISGTGEVIEPEYGVCAIGSGGNYAFAAGRALLDNTDLSAREIATKCIEIAGDICVFTNHHITVEEV